MSAIRSNILATLDNPINDRKGCGAVMRMAPVGLAYPKEKAFRFGCECGVITYGHPSGYLSAGVLSCIIAGIIEGMELIDTVRYSIEEAKKYEGNEECVEVLEMAIYLADSNLSCEDSIYNSKLFKKGDYWR